MSDYQDKLHQENNLIGAVVIGRNEGERLKVCLKSLKKDNLRIVYVDSGSTDNSVNIALEMTVAVVNLDMSQPFTAARARNAGFNRLLIDKPSVEYVQFVDGDCEVSSNWIASGVDFLNQHPQVAVVCGRRKERYPTNSVYNQLCDVEWNTPIGKAKACGGDAIMRVNVVKQVNGFNDTLIAGEEPELCIRIRRLGYDVWRLDHVMTLHDAAIFRFNQWWKRTIRAGYAYAEGSHLHGAAPEYHWVKESRRAWIWGAFVPLAWLLLFLLAPIWSWLVLLLIIVQFLRLTWQHKGLGSFAPKFAIFLILGKFAEAIGQFKYLWHRFFNVKSTLIEYK